MLTAPLAFNGNHSTTFNNPKLTNVHDCGTLKKSKFNNFI